MHITNRKTLSDRHYNPEGFSLIEVMLAMVIGTMVLSAIYVATYEGQKASTGVEQKISEQQDVRAALDIISDDLAMASFNPTGGGSLWISTNCGASGSGVAANKGIQVATPNQIAIEMDTNGNGAIDAPTELITYNFDIPNQQITRLTGCGAPPAFLGDVTAPSTTARNVKVVNNLLGISMFRYFDGNNTEIFPTSVNTAPIPNIRKIHVTIAVEAAAADIQGQTRRLIYSTDIIPRNHVIQASLP